MAPERDLLLGRSLADKPLPPHISNVGLLATPDFGDARVLDAAMLGPVLYPPHFEFVISGFGESLTASAGFCETGLTRAEVEDLFDRFLAELPS